MILLRRWTRKSENRDIILRTTKVRRPQLTTTADVINSALDALLSKKISVEDYLIVVDQATALEKSQNERGLVAA